MEWHPMLMHLLDQKTLWGLFSLIMFFVFLATIIRLHFSRNYHNFDLIKLLALDKAGNPSDSKLRLNIAFIVTTWAFVFLTMSDKLTEWYVTVFLTAWVTDRFFARKNTLEEDKK